MNVYLYNDEKLKSLRKNLRNHQTIAEQKLWHLIRNKQLNDIRFLRQYSVGTYILDFYAPKVRLSLEIDGGQHDEPNHKVKDQNREKFLMLQGIHTLRFWNNEVLTNTEGVIERIAQKIMWVLNIPS